MSVIAGVDVGNATTEVVLVSGDTILGTGRAPTRGRKGSADSLRAAAALVRRVERQAGCTVSEARIAPLRAVDTSVVTIPAAAPAAGRLKVLAAGVPTPGGRGVCVGRPLPLDGPADGGMVVALVPEGLRYDQAAARLRDMLAAGTRIGAVLVAGDEGVLIANRLPAPLPVIDQADVAAAAGCELLAVEVAAPGHPLGLLTDAIALGARLGVDPDEAAAVCRTLIDCSNAVVGLGAAAVAAAAAPEPWVVTAEGERRPLRAALAGWPPGTVRAFGEVAVDDLFAVDLSAAADAATARRDTVGRAVLVATLSGAPPARPGRLLGDLLGVPVRCLLAEQAASRLGALTTPGARQDAVVVDLGAGTIDVIGASGSGVVVAGAGELLTIAVAETLGITRAAADWVKREPCIRVDGGRRFEAEDGTRGFLEVSAPASAAGMLAVRGPGGLLPFDRRHGPGEWRALRIRGKDAVLRKNLERAMRVLGQEPSQVIAVGGPAGDEELLGVLARSLPGGVPAGRGNVGGVLGHRYAVALGLTAATA